MKVNYVVSLGLSCRVTYNLRRFFDFGTAFPLDWWVTNLRGVINAIDPNEDPFSNLVDSITEDGVTQIRTSDHNIAFHHEFPRDWSAPGAPVRQGWRNHIEAARNRFKFLHERLLRLNHHTSTILFVRDHGDAWDGDNPASIDDLIEFMNIVFDRSENFFLLINAPAPKPKCENVSVLTFDDPPGNDWIGDQWIWKSELSKINTVLENPLLKRFSEENTPEVEIHGSFGG